MKGYCIMNIYEKIFARLEELHMSQIELSRRTGIATSTISDWRKKQINPQTDKLVAICKALDMSLQIKVCIEFFPYLHDRLLMCNYTIRWICSHIRKPA